LYPDTSLWIHGKYPKTVRTLGSSASSSAQCLPNTNVVSNCCTILLGIISAVEKEGRSIMPETTFVLEHSVASITVIVQAAPLYSLRRVDILCYIQTLGDLWQVRRIGPEVNERIVKPHASMYILNNRFRDEWIECFHSCFSSKSSLRSDETTRHARTTQVRIKNRTVVNPFCEFCFQNRRLLAQFRQKRVIKLMKTVTEREMLRGAGSRSKRRGDEWLKSVS